MVERLLLARSVREVEVFREEQRKGQEPWKASDADKFGVSGSGESREASDILRLEESMQLGHENGDDFEKGLRSIRRQTKLWVEDRAV